MTLKQFIARSIVILCLAFLTILGFVSAGCEFFIIIGITILVLGIVLIIYWAVNNM